MSQRGVITRIGMWFFFAGLCPLVGPVSPSHAQTQVAKPAAPQAPPTEEWVSCPLSKYRTVPTFNASGSVTCTYYDITDASRVVKTEVVQPSVAGKKFTACLRDNGSYRATRSPEANKMFCSYVASQKALVESAYTWKKSTDKKEQVDFGYRVVTVHGSVLPKLVLFPLALTPVSWVAAVAAVAITAPGVIAQAALDKSVVSTPEALGVCRTLHGGKQRHGRLWRGKCYFPYEGGEESVDSAIEHLVLTKPYGVPMERKVSSSITDEVVLQNPGSLPIQSVRVCAAVDKRDDVVDGQSRTVYLKAPGSLPPGPMACVYSAKGKTKNETDVNSIVELVLK